MDLYHLLGIVALICIAILVIVFIFLARTGSSDRKSGRRGSSGRQYKSPEKQAGDLGEEVAAAILQRHLNDGDIWLRNVSVEYNGKPAELDNVVINTCGVFVIEVKNYVGLLRGTQEDAMWRKYKVTQAGNVFEEEVRNPIKQVNREIYILANYLRSNGVDVWVNGYVYLVQGNSPIVHPMILANGRDMYLAVHMAGRKYLNKQTMTRIRELLS